jgi:16S rRNA (cytosine967-C5)-methyltransferase
MRYQSYLNTACQVIRSYHGVEPFSIFLKKFFAASNKYGSTDRRQITSLCYHYFRLGKAVPDIPVAERIILAAFLIEQSHNDFLQFHQPKWNENIAVDLDKKLSLIDHSFAVTDIFPWKDKLSGGADHLKLCMSFLQQPLLFLRARPGKKEIVFKKLKDAGLNFTDMFDDCIALSNSSKLDGIIEIDKDAVVQDYNSQKVLDYLKHTVSGSRHPVSTWDCCAASGGKSILAYDILQGKIELSVSDIREMILTNLKKRFSVAGIDRYKSFLTDLNAPNCELPTASCELLICDAPCTGSGTWSRTPEQLFYFDVNDLAIFSERQKKIVSNAIPCLNEEGLFVYITCSVFAAENEMIVDFIKEKFHLQLLQMDFLKGYDKKADNMFVAVFSK